MHWFRQNFCCNRFISVTTSPHYYFTPLLQNSMLSRNPQRILFSLRSFLSILKPNPNPSIPFSPYSSSPSWLSIPGNPLMNWPSLLPTTQPKPNPTPNQNPIPEPDFSPDDFTIISNLITNPSISPGSEFHSELNQTGIEPNLPLLHALFDHFNLSPKLLYSLFVWAEKRPGFRTDPGLFDSMVNVLGKAKEFDSAWSLVLDRIDRDYGDDDEEKLVSVGTFAILIRRYARAGNWNIL